MDIFTDLSRKTQFEDEVSKRDIAPVLCPMGFGMSSIHGQRLQLSDTPRKQNKSI